MQHQQRQDRANAIQVPCLEKLTAVAFWMPAFPEHRRRVSEPPEVSIHYTRDISKTVLVPVLLGVQQ